MSKRKVQINLLSFKFSKKSNTVHAEEKEDTAGPLVAKPLNKIPKQIVVNFYIKIN